MCRCTLDLSYCTHFGMMPIKRKVLSDTEAGLLARLGCGASVPQGVSAAFCTTVAESRGICHGATLGSPLESIESPSDMNNPCCFDSNPRPSADGDLLVKGS